MLVDVDEMKDLIQKAAAIDLSMKVCQRRVAGILEYDTENKIYYFYGVKLDPEHTETWGKMILGTLAKITLEEVNRI